LQDTTARTEHPGKNSHGRTARTGQSGQDSHDDETARKRLLGKTARTRQPGKNSKDRTPQDSQGVTDGKRQPGKGQLG
jgi:hypothetical protein